MITPKKLCGMPNSKGNLIRTRLSLPVSYQVLEISLALFVSTSVKDQFVYTTWRHCMVTAVNTSELSDSNFKQEKIGQVKVVLSRMCPSRENVQCWFVFSGANGGQVLFSPAATGHSFPRPDHGETTSCFDLHLMLFQPGIRRCHISISQG